jgi:hypothetical protein
MACSKYKEQWNSRIIETRNEMLKRELSANKKEALQPSLCIGNGHQY